MSINNLSVAFSDCAATKVSVYACCIMVASTATNTSLDVASKVEVPPVVYL